MITPAYAPTATERVLPRLALDFTTGVLAPRVTVTRALNTATRVNSSGFIEAVNANLPRFDYDPVTLAPKGLLIEETRSNSVTFSEDFSNVIWSLTGATISADAAVSPSGVANADKLVEDTSTGQHRTFQSFSATNGVAYTFTVYVKQAGRTLVKLTSATGAIFEATYDINAGTVTNTVSGSASISAAGNGWYRLIITATASATQSTNLQIRLVDSGTNTSYTGDGISGIYLWGAQVEAGAFATSYIPTTTTSLTRNADVVSMTGTNFSSWYNTSESTLLAEASTFSNAATDKFVANINNNGFPNRILMNFSSLNNFSASVVSNSVTQVTGTNGVAAALNTPIKMCFATKLDNFAFSQSGVAPTTDSLGAMPVTVDRLWIGSAFTTAFLNGHMRQIKYWPQRVINAEVQAFSK